LCGVYQGKIHGVTLGCLNENPQIEIGRHMFVGSKASWKVLSASITQYQEDVLENT